VGYRGSRKSIGGERTIGSGLHSLSRLMEILGEISEKIAKSMEKRGLSGRTVTLKIRYSDFRRITRSRTLGLPIQTANKMMEILGELILQTEAGRKSVRLVGMSISNL